MHLRVRPGEAWSGYTSMSIRENGWHRSRPEPGKGAIAGSGSKPVSSGWRLSVEEILTHIRRLSPAEVTDLKSKIEEWLHR